MFNLTDEISKSLIQTIATSLITAITTIAVTIWLAIKDPLANLLAEKVPQTILFLLLIVLIVLLGICVFYILVLRKKQKNLIDDYEFDEIIGILRQPNDKLTYCISCMHKGIKSPLRVQENGWQCLNKDCHTFYSNPNYKAPSFKPIYKRGQNFVTDY